MAVRINVTAVRNCPPEELRAVMSRVLRPVCKTDDCQPLGDQLQLTEHDGWVWFNTSVWGVSPADLNRGLCQLAQPALQFTSSDGSRWYMTVHGGPGGQVHFNHEFSLLGSDPDPADDAQRQADLEQQPEPEEVDPALAFLADDPPAEEARPRTHLDQLVSALGEPALQMPEHFRMEATALPYSQVAAKFRRWHADQIMNALTAARIPFNQFKVRGALLWEGLTDQERFSDLGNLPRLLWALGLGGQWDQYIRDVENPPPPVEQCDVEEPELDAGSSAPPPDHIAPVLRQTEALALTPLEGGPVELEVKRLDRLGFIVEAFTVGDRPGVVLSVSLPKNKLKQAPAPSDGDVEIKLTADGFRLGFLDSGSLHWDALKMLLGKELTRTLSRAADGTILDLAFAAEGRPALIQRYRGPLAGGQWRIAETYPPLSADALKEGLELAARRDRERQKVRDDAEAEAVLALARRDPCLHDNKVERDGLTLSCEFDFDGALARAIFRHRHGAAWNLAAYERDAAAKLKQQAEQRRAMRRAAAEAARRRAAPHDQEVLFRGQAGLFWRSAFEQLTDLEQDTRQQWDAALAALGFQYLGDLVAKKQRDIVLRIHARPDGSCYGVLMGKRTMYLGQEFFTRFADGSTLTTTTNGAVDSHPEVGVYYVQGGGLTPEGLYEKHLWGVERFRNHKHTTPAALPLTLVGVAAEIDAAFTRVASVEAEDLVALETIEMENGADEFDEEE